MSAANKFEEALRSWPSAGGGVHTHMMAVCNFAVIAKLNPVDLEREIIRTMPRPPNPSSEVAAAIRKAYAEFKGGSDDYRPNYAKPTKPQPRPLTRQAVVQRGNGWTEADVWESSIIRISWEPGKADLLALFDAGLWSEDEYLFIGGQYDTKTRPVSEWRNLFTKGADLPNFICPNPMKPEGALLASGKRSFRCDDATAAFRFAVLEMDTIPKDEQLSFWHGLPSLPVAMMCDSGGKSVHVWVRVDCADKPEWDAVVKRNLFEKLLVPLGVDGACSNPARLSRTPGAWRQEKQAFQKLLFLNPDAGRDVR